MTSSQKISALAEKAIEARNKYKGPPHDDPEGFKDCLYSLETYKNAASPEAWLALRNEVEALRAALRPIFEAHAQYKLDCPECEPDPVYEAIEQALKHQRPA